ncbi:MAG: hypothetical protein K8S98_08540 [Planctomycetes bacterium]|nr:hypothetical protein [Planctomycetota bacterium]
MAVVLLAWCCAAASAGAQGLRTWNVVERSSAVGLDCARPLAAGGAGSLDVRGRALELARGMLGLPKAFELVVRSESANAVVVAAEFEGLPVEGVEARVAFDSSKRVLGVRAAPTSLAVRKLGAFELDATEVVACLASEGRRVEVVRAAWRPEHDGLAPCWIVRVERGARSLQELVVDARDGGVLERRELVHFGSGTYPWFGERVTFATTHAKGSVYATVADALATRATQRTFKGWSLGVPAPVGLPRGFLTGAHVDVYDAQSAWALNASGKFDYSTDAYPDFFDQASAYWHVESCYRHLRKVLGRELASDYALPVIVNAHDTLPGGYYSPAPFVDGHVAGEIVLFDLENFLGPGADSARDPTLVAHEYVHAWLDREGRAFTGAVGDPTRALEEGLADFFAAAKNKTDAIGPVLAQFAGPLWLRDLDDGDHLAETLADARAKATQGLFDEHRAGEVFASFLCDVRRELGTKQTERLVDRSIELMPHSMAELGLASVAPPQAIAAGAKCFASATLALLTTASSQAEQAALVGAATGRGIFGDPASAIDVELQLEAYPKRRVTLPSAFALGTETHGYFFRADPGRMLTLTVVAADGSNVAPDFEIVGPVVVHGAKSVSDGGRRIVQSGIELTGPVGTTYEVRVTSSDHRPGRYRLRLDA